MEPTLPGDELVPNRATRRAAGRRGRKLAALGSGAVLVGSAGGAVISSLTATSASATTQWTVNQPGDAGDGTCDVTCTFRDAVIAASNDNDDSQIVFAPSITGTITLTQGELKIANGTDTDKNLTITGPGAATLSVVNDGVTLDRIFYANSNFGTATLSISGLTITNGSVAGPGGAIKFYGDSTSNLTLTNTVITANQTTGAAGSKGGAIFFYGAGNLTVANSTISNNTSASAAKGGGVFIQNSGNMIVTNSTISGNKAGPTGNGSGGGVFMYDSGDMIVTSSTFSGNSGRSGAAAKFYQSGDMTVTNSTVSGNTSSSYGGGIKLYDSDSLTITNSTITNNTATVGSGGGIDFYEGGHAHDGVNTSLTIINSTISGNTAAREGGGIQFYDHNTVGHDTNSTLTILDSTISGNSLINPGSSAQGNGGGLYTSADNATIANSTFSGNSAAHDGGGIAVLTGNVSLLQSTISGNTAGPAAHDYGDGLYLRGAGPSVEVIAGTATTADVKPAQDHESDKNPKPPKPARVSATIGAQAVGTINLVGTIISGNGTADIETQSTATVNSTNSLWGTKNAGITITDLGGTINSTSPLLGALASNGGPTQTMALLAGSPALDTGPTTVPTFTGNQFDQRGTGHPRVVNGRVDIGAYEKALVVRFTG